MKNKACMPLLKLFHLPGMFHLYRYLWKLLFLCQYPRFPLNASPQWLTTLFKYNLSLHCALNSVLSAVSQLLSIIPYCNADTMKAWSIKFNFVTETEHISDKCLLSEWRLLDDLHVCNGPLKICLFCLLEKSGRNIPNKGIMVTLEENHICLCGKKHVSW